MGTNTITKSCIIFQGAPYQDKIVKGTREWNLHEQPEEIDSKDENTPDDWVPRHPEIIRLTGRHPLNCEAPISRLMAAGFITPVSLHIVRNHGPVPKLDWKTHKITIKGLVNKQIELTMDDILKFPSITIPVTVTCAGNRRKEENMIKKTIGFNWGTGATSCTYWTGARLSDVLRYAETKSPSEGAHYVCFRGPLGELPKGDDGSYGTSMTLSYALDPANDVLIAYKQNGRWLQPDHGYPVRMLIPGFIGGRMVKWLTEITVTEKESDNHYHYHDNRVLPPHVDETIAKEEGWWFKKDYIINELNINSAISNPSHGEIIYLDQNKPYKLRGYAYSGGGRKIIRVEISLNNGKVWRQAIIHRFEKPNPFGKYWCWIFWELNVNIIEFTRCDEILLRAWDSSQNTQPAELTWNVMGMMNNSYFRVKIHPYTDEKGNIGLRFQHPSPIEETSDGFMGWRDEENLNLKEMENKASFVNANGKSVKINNGKENVNVKTYEWEEIEKHDSEKSCWFVHDGKVYDATSFLIDHPGGGDSILLVGGQDATVEFDSVHSEDAKRQLKDYYIGDVA